MSSLVSICNTALQHLGVARINALDEPVRAARECKVTYPIVRDELLERHSWQFALAEVELAAQSAGRYPLPADLIKINANSLGLRGWRVEGRSLVVDGAYVLGAGGGVRLRYIRRVEDPAAMPPLFRSALAYHLALRLTQTFAPSVSQLQLLTQMADRTLADARWSDAQASGPQRYQVIDGLEQRHGGGYGYDGLYGPW